MNQQNFSMLKTIRFRRFKRAGFAVFNSLHRVVNIGRLVSYIADRQLLKSAFAMAMFAVLFTENAYAQTDEDIPVNLLPALDVVAVADTQQGSPDAVAVISRQQLSGLPISSVGELLEQLPGLDLRTRGVGDVQGDLTMRGGTFDQMIVLLNGVNLTDAQTGHHNLDIPIDLSMVDRVEIIPSSALHHYGLSSFCGAVNIVIGERGTNQARFELSGGSFGSGNVAAGVSRQLGRWALTTAASYHRSNGYRENTDYDHGSLYLQARNRDKNGEWVFQMGGQLKDFGSQDFYSTKYPTQFESTRTLMVSMTRQQMWKRWHFESVLYGRLHKDRFELFRQGVTVPPAWYTGHNYHLSANAGLRLRASNNWALGQSSIGCEIRDEGIVSSVLGDTLSRPINIIGEPDNIQYSFGKNRIGANVFAEHGVCIHSLKLAASLLGGYNSLFGANYGYSLSADYPLHRSLNLRGSIGRSFRLPTYTDLYYHSATQESNPNLMPEVSHHAEVNLNYHTRHYLASATLYGRHGSNIIDWVRLPEETVWHSVNHAAIDAMGAELQGAYIGGGCLKRVGVSYSFCTLAQQADGYISNYVLDYLRHKVSGDVVVSPLKNVRIKLLATYHCREGQYSGLDGALLKYDPVVLFNAGVDYTLQHFSFFADGYNLLNRQYCDYGGIPQPGISFLAGVRMTY